MSDDLWKPDLLRVGDVVSDPDRPEWGCGIVIDDRTAARSPTCGQRVVVEFERRGRVTILTATRRIRKASNA